MQKHAFTRRHFLHVTGATGLATVLDLSALQPASFTLEADAQAVRVRQPISSFDPNGAAITQLRAGVKQMMAWNPSDPNSDPSTWDPRCWLFQAYIHGTPQNAAPVVQQYKSFNHCPHGCYYFLPWHRGYLYFFERILRFAIKEATGQDFEALPYWDYDVPDASPNTPNPKRALPLPFRSPNSESTNALYVQLRKPSMNNGGIMPWDVINPCQAYQQTNFTSNDNVNFGSLTLSSQCLWSQAEIPEPCDWDGSGMGKLERQPHNNVHNQIGGTMGTSYSPRDPIFWLHHCNIDRLWQRWLALGGGRSNPLNDSNWSGCQFTFFDENKQPQTISPSQLVNTESLPSPYRYADASAPVIQGCVLPATPVLAANVRSSPTVMAVQPPQKKAITPLVSSQRSDIALGAQPLTVPVAVSAPRFKTLVAAAGAPASEVVLTLEGITFDQHPGTHYEVYLNLPKGTKPERFGPYYVGDLGFFELNTHRHGGAHPQDVSFPLDEVLARLKARNQLKTGALNVTLVPRGSLGPDGKEVVELMGTPRIAKISIGTR